VSSKFNIEKLKPVALAMSTIALVTSLIWSCGYSLKPRHVDSIIENSASLDIVRWSRGLKEHFHESTTFCPSKEYNFLPFKMIMSSVPFL
jgi:hypothetical protein